MDEKRKARLLWSSHFGIEEIVEEKEVAFRIQRFGNLRFSQMVFCPLGICVMVICGFVLFPLNHDATLLVRRVRLQIRLDDLIEPVPDIFFGCGGTDALTANQGAGDSVFIVI